MPPIPARRHDDLWLRPAAGAAPSRAVGILVVLGLLLAACAEPAMPEDTEGEGAERPVEVQTPDPGREALFAQLNRLRTVVAVARDELADAMQATNAASGRRAGERAVAFLVADPEELGAEAIDDADAPLFPSTTTERGSTEGADDLLTGTLTAARDAGGTLGRAALDLLRDPIAGDLGTWQRDPAGVVAAVRSTAASSTDLAGLEAAVLELPGEGTRALAWALLTADPPTAADLSAYAERGVAHLDLIVSALDDLLGNRAEETTDRGTTDGDDAAEEEA